MSIVARGLFVAGVVLLAVGGLRLRPGHTSHAAGLPMRQVTAAPTPARAYRVSGAGDKASNGVYRLAGRWHGQPWYRKAGRVLYLTLTPTGYLWCISHAQVTGKACYVTGLFPDAPPLADGAMFMQAAGKAPAPTVTAVKTR